MTIKIVNGGALIITGEYHTPPTGVQGGPQTLSFKDWKKDENGYNFKLTTGDDILIRVDIYTENRDDIINILKKHNIQTRKTYTEINKSNIYYSEKILPNSNSSYLI